MTAPRVPAGAIDAHVHLFDPQRHPFADGTPYRPAPAECGSAADLACVLAAHGLAAALVVAPTSGYGYDNRCLLAGLAAARGRWRGIVRVPVATPRARLRALAARGVAGVRIDLVGDGLAPLADPAFPRLLAALAAEDLVLDVQCEREQFAAVAPHVVRAGVRVVVDHCGRPDPARGLRQPGFADLLRAADSGRVAVKLSGAFRFAGGPWPYPRADRYVAALLAAFGPDHCVFGSDWPFVRMPHRVDYAPALALLERWVPDARVRRRILVETPRRWFRFPARAH